MTKSLLIAMTALVTLPALAGWTAIHQEQTSAGSVTTYIDWDTLRVKGNSRRVWTLVDRQLSTSGEPLSLRSLREFDCQEERIRTWQSESFVTRMASGRPTSSSNGEPSNWTFIAPNTVGDGLLRAACSFVPLTAERPL